MAINSPHFERRQATPDVTRILLVDADARGASQVQALLPSAGAERYLTQHAVDFAAAVTLLRDFRFDVILLDLGTPVGRGDTVLRQMIDQAAHIPIVALTQTEDEQAGITAVQGGAQDFLVKSHLNGDMLRRVIRYSIDRLHFRRDVDGLAREIDQRQRITDALSDSQNRMMAITDSLYEGVLVFDESGHIALSNRAADRLLGDSGRLTGRQLDSVLRLKRADRLLDFHNGPLRQVIASGDGMQDDDAVILRQDGRPLAVALACVPLVEKQGVQGAILSFRDISGVKQAQREALQASKLASVGQLAAGIAHEINTPIQYIGDNLSFLADAFQALSRLLSSAEALLAAPGAAAAPALASLAAERERLDADFLLGNIPEATRQSLEGVAQVARIVLAMKEFSHPGERDKAETDLNRAVENTLAVSRNEWKRWAQLETHLAADLPRVFCLAGEINQVLLNLIVNAAQAIEEAERGPAGKIVVTTCRKGDMVEITIADNGTGMSEDVRQQIFDPFFTTKRVGKGTGQGLAICRDVVVAKHGGRISVDSTPGEGSRFSVMLPIQHLKPAAEEDA